MKLALKKNKELRNAAWLIGGKVAQMLLALVVGILSARYLGPSNYGLINYGNAYISFCMSLCTLGINSVIVKELIDNPEKQGEALGTGITLRLVSSILSTLLILSVVSILDRNEPETIAVVWLCSISLVFHAFDTLNYWFQAHYLSRITAIATFTAYCLTSAYKIVLLILGKDVKWFAFASSVDYIVLSILLCIAYRKHKGQRLSFSFAKGKCLLGKSYHYILSSLMVAIYGQTDKLMLKHMLDESAVGYYSIATAVCAMWVFVLQAIIDAVYPTIMRLHSVDKAGFERKNRQLYAAVFYISIGVSVLFTLFGGLVIQLLYGADYSGAIAPLKVVTWYTAFSYLGVARNAWIVCENKQRYLKYLYLCAAVLNVVLNYLLIPYWGAIGAATASLITQISTSILLPMCFKGMRENASMMLHAIMLKDVLPKKN